MQRRPMRKSTKKTVCFWMQWTTTRKQRGNNMQIYLCVGGDMNVCPIKKHSCGSRHRIMEPQPISESYVESAGKKSACLNVGMPRTEICGSSGRSLPQKFKSSKGPPRARKFGRSHLHNTDRTYTHGVGALSILQPSEDIHLPTINVALKAHNRTHGGVEQAGRPIQSNGDTQMAGRRTALRAGLQGLAQK